MYHLKKKIRLIFFILIDKLKLYFIKKEMNKINSNSKYIFQIIFFCVR